MIDLERVKAARFEGRERTYTDKDVRIYALSIGFGSDPLDEDELGFVDMPPNLRVMPAMAVILCSDVAELFGRIGVEKPHLALHREQRLTLHKPLPPQAELVIDGHIGPVYDRGEGKGALIDIVATARLKGEEAPLFTTTFVSLARGDGGFGGPPPDPAGTALSIPEREPDSVRELTTHPAQALWYSLNGDLNPIHLSPEAARAAGFERPILHGLCTYALACRAVLGSECAYRPERIRSFDVRFSAPFYPGETLVVEMWRQGDGVLFQARAKDRDVLVLKDGRCRLAGA